MSITFISRVIALPSLFVLTIVFASPAFAQPPQSYPAFTLVTEVTDYDPHGKPTPVGKETRYDSSTGNWRSTSVGSNNRVRQTIFVQRRGVFFADERNQRFVKMSDCVIANCLPHPVTAEALLADPKFVRIERVLGVVAYVEKNARGDLTYIVPELGDTPFKRIRFIKGYKRVEEPVKLTLGEPDGADVRGPDYPLVTERPVFDQDLEARIIEKPSPQFELAVAPSKSTTVTVEVVVDESGNVVNAWCVGDFCFSRVGRTAEEAAYNARVATKEVAGKSVISMGLIRYPIAAS